jgi:hypothetical protein
MDKATSKTSDIVVKNNRGLSISIAHAYKPNTIAHVSTISLASREVTLTAYSICMAIPGRSVSPVRTLAAKPSCEKAQLTSILVFLHNFSYSTRLSSCNVLIGHCLALCAHAVRSVHPNLQFISLPAKDVIGMLSEAGIVAVAEVERLRAVCGPNALIIEWGCVPYHLVHQLRDSNRMS